MNKEFLSISPNEIASYRPNGTYFVNAGQTNNPDSTSQWIIVQNKVFSQTAGGAFGVQFAFAQDNTHAYYRMIWGNTGREWKVLA